MEPYHPGVSDDRRFNVPSGETVDSGLYHSRVASPYHPYRSRGRLTVGVDMDHCPRPVFRTGFPFAESRQTGTPECLYHLGGQRVPGSENLTGRMNKSVLRHSTLLH